MQWGLGFNSCFDEFKTCQEIEFFLNPLSTQLNETEEEEKVAE